MIPETPEERQKRFDMYEEVTTNFQEAMIKELDANSSKGDRKGTTGWLNMTNKENLSELYYHVGKLQEALRNENIDGIKEFSADVANLSMMIYDKYQPLVYADEGEKELRLRMPMNFFTWYSGMVAPKIKKAYERWKKETQGLL